MWMRWLQLVAKPPLPHYSLARRFQLPPALALRGDSDLSREIPVLQMEWRALARLCEPAEPRLRLASFALAHLI